ncbi:hypothetical protein IJC60_00815 [bacterium]|nr:hypothetical protein [bacterium]
MYTSGESETLILKRLESALNNGSSEQLKVAAYKLHEKFHSGHKFEYKNELKQVLDYVETQSFEEDTTILLTSTIKEILSQTETIQEEKSSSVSDIIDSIFPSSNKFNGETVDLRQDTQNHTIEQNYAESFAPTSTHQEEAETPQEATNENYVNDFYKPKEELSSFQEELTQAQIWAKEAEEKAQSYTQTAEEKTQETQNPQTSYAQNYTQISSSEEIKERFEKAEEKNIETKIIENPKQESEIAIFYAEKNPDIDDNLIIETNNTIYKNESFTKTIDTLKTFINLAECDLGKVDELFSAIYFYMGKISLTTTSVNGKILDILTSLGIKPKEENRNFYPLQGSTRLFKCDKCKDSVLLEKNTLISECENCSGTFLPNITTSTNFISATFEESFASFINANVWILINPPLMTANPAIVRMFELAATISAPEEVYILTHDEVKKDFYESMFKRINDNIITKSKYNSNEEFYHDFQKMI